MRAHLLFGGRSHKEEKLTQEGDKKELLVEKFYNSLFLTRRREVV